MLDIYKEMFDNKSKLSLILIFILICLSSILSMYPLILIRDIVDLAVLNNFNNINLILRLGFVYLIVQVARSITLGLISYLTKKIQSNLSLKLQIKIFNHLKNVSMESIRFGDSSEFSQRVLNDTEYISQNTIQPFNILVQSILTFILGLYFMSKINKLLILIILPLGLISSIVTKVISKESSINIEALREKSEKIWKIFNEGILGFIPLRLHGNINKYISNLELKGKELQEVHIKQGKIESIALFVTSSLFMITIGLVMIISALFVIQGKLSIGGLTAIMMYNHMLTDPLIRIQEVNQQIIKLKVSLNRVSKIFNMPIEPCSYKIKPINEIKVSNISLELDGKYIFENVSYSIKPKTSHMFKGVSGVGKTSLINLLTGIYKPSEGDIEFLYNGKEIKAKPKISYMMQDEYIFDDSIINNIKVGNENISLDYLNKLITICQLEGVIDTHKDKPVGENGIKLSGGERKRVLIARTLADFNSDIFIFDEMSTSLDGYLFDLIFKEVDRLLYDKIRLYIEHNLSIEKMVDRIIIVENAGIEVLSY